MTLSKYKSLSIPNNEDFYVDSIRSGNDVLVENCSSISCRTFQELFEKYKVSSVGWIVRGVMVGKVQNFPESGTWSNFLCKSYYFPYMFQSLKSYLNQKTSLPGLY